MTDSVYRGAASPRDPGIDVARGIAMILVVGGHSWLPFWCSSGFVSLFHMSLFMTISGYCFRERHMESRDALFHYILHRLKTLYLPYAIGNAVFILLNNVFLKLQIYCGDNVLAEEIQTGVGMDPWLSPSEMMRQVLSCFLFIGYSPRMGGATWFLRALFFISILYAVIGSWIRMVERRAAQEAGREESQGRKGRSARGKNLMDLQMLLSLFFLLLWAVNEMHPFLHFGSSAQIFQYYFAYALGDFCRRHGLMRRVRRMPAWGVLCVGSYCLLQFILALETGFFSAADPAGAGEAGACVISVLQTFLFQAGNGILGWVMVYGVSQLVCRFAVPLERILIPCGQATLETLLLHFLCFKVVTELYIVTHHLPQFYLGATPVLPGMHAGWGCFYILAGVGIPTGIHMLRHMLRMRRKGRIRGRDSR